MALKLSRHAIYYRTSDINTDLVIDFSISNIIVSISTKEGLHNVVKVSHNSGLPMTILYLYMPQQLATTLMGAPSIVLDSAGSRLNDVTDFNDILANEIRHSGPDRLYNMSRAESDFLVKSNKELNGDGLMIDCLFNFRIGA